MSVWRSTELEVGKGQVELGRGRQLGQTGFEDSSRLVLIRRGHRGPGHFQDDFGLVTGQFQRLLDVVFGIGLPIPATVLSASQVAR